MYKIRRQDKEQNPFESLKTVIKAQNFIRLGFFCEKKALIRPFKVIDFFENRITIDSNIHQNKISIHNHIFEGIKTDEKICSYSAKYLSVYGTGQIKRNTIIWDFISGKASNFADCRPLQNLKTFEIKESNFDLNLADTLQLGICHNDEVYIVAVQQGKINDKYYFHSAKQGRKQDLLQLNNNIIIEAEILQKENLLYQNKNAKVSKVYDEDEKSAAMAAIVYKTANINYNFNKNQLQNIDIFKIEI